MAWRINVESARNLVEVARPHGVRFVHLSVDLVFSGIGDGGHVETDPVDPVTMYGKTMVAAERMILDRLPSAAVLRISLPMGISLSGHAGAIDWIQSRFKKSRPATLYIDEVRTPTYAGCLSRLAEQVLARDDLHGIYHAGAAAAELVSSGAGDQPDWRLRPRLPHRLSAGRGRANAAPGGQRLDGFEQAPYGAGL